MCPGSPPGAAAPPRQWTMVGVATHLRRRPRPRLGAGEPGPSRGAFPFSAAENFLHGAIGGTASNEARKKKRAEQEEMSDEGSAPSSFIAGGGQPTTSTIAGNDGFYTCTRDSSRAVAEAAWGTGDAHVPSIATRQSRPQAVGARDAPHLPLGFSWEPSTSTPWARVLLSVF